MNTEYLRVAYRAAKNAAPMLRWAVMDVDDCYQEAVLYLLRRDDTFWDKVRALPTEDARSRFVYVAAWRAITRSARGVEPSTTREPTFLAQCEATSLMPTIVLADLVRSAPTALVRMYLDYRVLCGMTWDETREVLGVSNSALADIRREAAGWLLTQFEEQE